VREIQRARDAEPVSRHTTLAGVAFASRDVAHAVDASTRDAVGVAVAADIRGADAVDAREPALTLRFVAAGLAVASEDGTLRGLDLFRPAALGCGLIGQGRRRLVGLVHQV